MDFLPLSRRRLTIIALAAYSLAVPGAAQAAYPGASGKLLFDDGAGLRSVAATGGAASTLSDVSYDFDPAVSPDGSRVAFVVNRDVYVMDADGSDRKALTTNGRFNTSPTWSPDGKRIVFSGGGVAGGAELYSVPSTGGAVTQLTSTPDNDEFNPRFSPDGTRIAYTRVGCDTPRGGGSCVFVMRADGSGQANLTPEDEIPGCEQQPGYYFDGSTREPSWSPDGRRILFTGPLICTISSLGSDIWMMNADGSGKTDLTRDNATNDREAVFSPDGTQIAFTREDAAGHRNLYLLTGTGATLVAAGNDVRDPDWGVAPKQCVVPKLTKSTLAEAKADLALMGCRLGKVERKQTKAAKNTVLAQIVKPGQRLRLNAKVGVTIAR